MMLKYFEYLCVLMQEHTWSHCKDTCQSLNPLKCCCFEYCTSYIEGIVPEHREEAENWREPEGVESSFGHTHLDPETMKCTVPPHLKMHCILHQCGIAALGMTRDPVWDERYWILRNEMNRVAGCLIP